MLLKNTHPLAFSFTVDKKKIPIKALKKEWRGKEKKRLVNIVGTIRGHRAVETNVIVRLSGRSTENFLFLDFYGDLV